MIKALWQTNVMIYLHCKCLLCWAGAYVVVRQSEAQHRVEYIFYCWGSGKGLHLNCLHVIGWEKAVHSCSGKMKSLTYQDWLPVNSSSRKLFLTTVWMPAGILRRRAVKKVVRSLLNWKVNFSLAMLCNFYCYC